MLRVLLPISALSIIAVQAGPILLAIDRFDALFRVRDGTMHRTPDRGLRRVLDRP